MRLFLKVEWALLRQQAVGLSLRKLGRWLCEAQIPPSARIGCSLAELGTIQLIPVPSRWSRNYRLWRHLLQTHHYLGAGPLCGHQLRYLIKSAHGYLGAAAFSVAARRVAGRDLWIGWEERVRRENLHWIVNQSRFLILPWVEVPCLASHVLGQLTGCLEIDWQGRYGYRPVLVESFVELDRYPGPGRAAARLRIGSWGMRSGSRPVWPSIWWWGGG